MINQRKAYLFAGATVLLWSTVASAFKIALRDLDYVQVLFIAAFVSWLSLLAVLAFRGKLGELTRPSKPGLIRSAYLGFLNPLFYYLVLFKAYDLLPAQEAQPLNWTWPITLTIFSAIFLKQHMSLRKILAIVICFIGVIIISTHGNLTSLKFSNLFGDILAVGSSLLWASYWILNLKDEREPVIKLFWNFTFGVLYTTVALFILSEAPVGFSLSCIAAVYIGLFEMGLAFVLWMQALKYSRDSASVGTFAFLTPFLSLIFIYFVLGETILMSSVVGLVLIIGGIVVGTVGRKVAS